MSDLAALRAEVGQRAGRTPAMLPAVAYTSPEVLAWELRHLYAGTWACLGRADELLPDDTTQRAVTVGDVGALLTRGPGGVRLFANTCRHRGHELLPEGEASTRQSVVCPYHAWTYDLGGSVVQAPGFREVADFEPATHGLVELPVTLWAGWVFGHGRLRLGDPGVVPFADHLGDLGTIVEPYRPEELRLADRHTYEVAANWKVVAENYHECYHCPLIHPELCQVSPPTSGDNYDLPGAWIGGRMDLRDGMATMSLTGESGGHPIPGVRTDAVEYVHLLPNLLISAHPDYVMTHRLQPLAPGRTWIECSWYLRPGEDGTLPDPAYAVEFWDLTNRQDWAACESVQRGLESPHFRPGPFAPNEDAVARFVAMVSRGYAGRPLHVDDPAGVEGGRMTQPTLVIVGAGPGVSGSVARRFAADGYALGLLGVDRDQLQRLEDELGSEGTPVAWAVADVTDVPAATAAVAGMGERFGRIDVLHFNPSAFRQKDPLHLTVPELLEDVALGVGALLTAVQAARPFLSSGARVTATGSMAADKPWNEAASLGVQKAGLRNLLHSLDTTLRPDGIRAVSVTVRGSLSDDGPFTPTRVAAAIHDAALRPDDDAWTSEVPYAG